MTILGSDGKIAKADVQTFMLLSAWIVLLALVTAITIGLIHPPENITNSLYSLFLTATGGLITWVVNEKSRGNPTA